MAFAASAFGAETSDAVRSILFVCTGNTCRSPLAEVLCKQLLARRLGITEAELPMHGYTVQSAGVMAGYGDAASIGAVEVAQTFGIDLNDHRSRPINPELLESATDVVAMTSSHAAVLEMYYFGFGPQPTLLCGPDGDLPDPIGGDAADYEACANLIAAQLDRLLPGWLST